MPDMTADDQPAKRRGCVAIFGGVYNNAHSLRATIDDAHAAGAEALFCLGDMGGFGPHPDSVFPLLYQHKIACLQGNYDHSIGNQLDDCACGYTDPRDNHFAQITYDYTRANTNPENREWLRQLPTEMRFIWGKKRVLFAHGSPRKTNEFLWESTSSDAYLGWLLDTYEADALFVTHTGIAWQRTLPDGRLVCNVGAIGRPGNDGTTQVRYALVRYDAAGLRVTLRAVDYDHHALAREMRNEGLPAEFIETIETGWWTTCLEVLPARERAKGKY